MDNPEIRSLFESEEYRMDGQERTELQEEGSIFAQYQILGMRRNQQDSLDVVCKGEDVLAVVCDGMGGLKGGEIASQTAVDLLRKDFMREMPCGDVGQFLMREALKIDRIVASLVDETGERLNAGTTLAAAVIHGAQLHFVSVGDSRIYLVRGRNMTRLTEDQNYDMTLRRSLLAGRIGEAEYRREAKYAEALISYIGMNGLKVIGCNADEETRLLPGDKLLICSDGLYKSLSEQEIARFVMECTASTLERNLRQLVDAAMDNAIRLGKKQDNTSAILLMKI